MRPVRLEPCAPGARPTSRSRAWGSPNPGTGLPQYVQSRNRAVLTRAMPSRWATSLGQRRQAMSWRLSWASGLDMRPVHPLRGASRLTQLGQVLGAQLPPQDLEQRAPGQRVPEFDHARDLVGGEVLPG